MTTNSNLLRRLGAFALAVGVIGLMMPQMSGPRLAKRLRALRPELPVVFMSGYPDDVARNEGMPAPLVQKPINLDALVAQILAVRETARHRLVAVA